PDFAGIRGPSGNPVCTGFGSGRQAGQLVIAGKEPVTVLTDIKPIGTPETSKRQKAPPVTPVARCNWRSMTMAKQLEKSQWRAYFDRVSKALVGKRFEIEVASLQLGDQIEAEWLPLLGISFDPKDDIIEIALEGV